MGPIQKISTTVIAAFLVAGGIPLLLRQQTDAQWQPQTAAEPLSQASSVNTLAMNAPPRLSEDASLSLPASSSSSSQSLPEAATPSATQTRTVKRQYVQPTQEIAVRHDMPVPTTQASAPVVIIPFDDSSGPTVPDTDRGYVPFKRDSMETSSAISSSVMSVDASSANGIDASSESSVVQDGSRGSQTIGDAAASGATLPQ